MPTIGQMERIQRSGQARVFHAKVCSTNRCIFSLFITASHSYHYHAKLSASVLKFLCVGSALNGVIP